MAKQNYQLSIINMISALLEIIPTADEKHQPCCRKIDTKKKNLLAFNFFKKCTAEIWNTGRLTFRARALCQRNVNYREIERQARTATAGNKQLNFNVEKKPQTTVLIMYIFTTLEFPTHNFDFRLLHIDDYILHRFEAYFMIKRLRGNCIDCFEVTNECSSSTTLGCERCYNTLSNYKTVNAVPSQTFNHKFGVKYAIRSQLSVLSFQR